MPEKYESCIDKVLAEAKANLDFKLNPLKKEPEELQANYTKWMEIRSAGKRIKQLPDEEYCDALTTMLTQFSDYLASPDFPQKKYSYVNVN